MAADVLKATLVFSDTTNVWNMPADANKGMDSQSFTDGTYTITLQGTTGGGYRVYPQDANPYLILGKQGATLTFQAFTWKTSKIVVTGRSGASGSVKQNIFVGEDAVSTETTGATGVNEYAIAADKQAAGTIYTLKVTSAHNTQITKIEIFEAGEDPQPIIDPWAEIFFKAETAAGSFNDSVFTAEGDFKLTCIDTDNAKIKTSSNDASFGTQEELKTYRYRLQTSGKSGSKNSMRLNIPAKGFLRIAVRTGSNSDSTRTLVLSQGTDTLYNRVVKESDAIDVPVTDSTTMKVYPYITVPVNAGEVVVGYPVNALNFYSFAFMGTVHTPYIDGEEEFTDSVIVTITCTTPDADIYYTTDGTTSPKCDCAAAPEYKKPIVIKETTTIKAAAYTGNDWSAIATKTFVKKEGPKNLGPKTIAEFLEMKNAVDTCILTGVVDSLVNTVYGNFNLVDATGKVYVYGLLTPDGQKQKFADLGVAEGDTLTVKALYGEYQGKPQAPNAIFVSVKKEPMPSPIDHTYFAYDNDWKQDTLSSAEWDAANEKVIVNIVLGKQAAWQAQVFCQTAFVVREGYEYQLKVKMKSNKDIGGVTVKYQDQPDQNPIYYRNDIALTANQEFAIDTAHMTGVGGGNGLIVFDFGYAAAGTVIEIYDLEIYETQDLAPISCAEVYSKSKNDDVVLNDVVVTFANGANVWVKDATGSMLIYLPSNTSVEWKAGDVLSGVAGTVDIYQTLIYEVKPSVEQVAAITATPGEAPEPVELNAVLAEDINKVIILKGIMVEGAFAEGTASNININVGNQAIVLRNQFKNAFTFVSGQAYDIIAVVSAYQGAVQLYFIDAFEAQGIENIVLTEKVQKVMVDGVLYIVRDGKMFNIQGAQVR